MPRQDSDLVTENKKEKQRKTRNNVMWQISIPVQKVVAFTQSEGW
jgi:hypothetical protein